MCVVFQMGLLFKFRTVKPVSNLTLYPTVVTCVCVCARNSFLQLHCTSTTVSFVSLYLHMHWGSSQSSYYGAILFDSLPATIWRCTRILSTTFICHLGSFYRIAADMILHSLLTTKMCVGLIWTSFTQLNGTNRSWAVVRCSCFLLRSKFAPMV